MANGVGRGLFLAVLGALVAAAVGAAAVAAVLSGTRPFTLKASPYQTTVIRGEVANYVITIVRSAGFVGHVQLGVAGGLPPQVNSHLVWSGSSRDQAILTVRTTRLTPLGTYHPSVFGKTKTYTGTVVLTLRIRRQVLPVPFGIRGGVGRIAPGVPGPLDLTLHNPNPSGIMITRLRVGVAQITAPNATPTLPCTRADFSTRQYSGAYPISLPPKGTMTLSELGIAPADWPREILIGRRVNQDGCRRAELSLTYSGTAVGP